MHAYCLFAGSCLSKDLVLSIILFILYKIEITDKKALQIYTGVKKKIIEYVKYSSVMSSRNM